MLKGKVAGKVRWKSKKIQAKQERRQQQEDGQKKEGSWWKFRLYSKQKQSILLSVRIYKTSRMWENLQDSKHYTVPECSMISRWLKASNLYFTSYNQSRMVSSNYVMFQHAVFAIVISKSVGIKSKIRLVSMNWQHTVLIRISPPGSTSTDSAAPTTTTIPPSFIVQDVIVLEKVLSHRHPPHLLVCAKASPSTPED